MLVKRKPVIWQLSSGHPLDLYKAAPEELNRALARELVILTGIQLGVMSDPESIPHIRMAIRDIDRAMRIARERKVPLSPNVLEQWNPLRELMKDHEFRKTIQSGKIPRINPRKRFIHVHREEYSDVFGLGGERVDLYKANPIRFGACLEAQAKHAVAAIVSERANERRNFQKEHGRLKAMLRIARERKLFIPEGTRYWLDRVDEEVRRKKWIREGMKKMNRKPTRRGPKP